MDGFLHCASHTSAIKLNSLKAGSAFAFLIVFYYGEICMMYVEHV